MIRMQLFGAAVVSAIAALILDTAQAVNLDTESTPAERQGLANVLSMAQSVRNDLATDDQLAQNGGSGNANSGSITQPFAQAMAQPAANAPAQP